MLAISILTLTEVGLVPTTAVAQDAAPIADAIAVDSTRLTETAVIHAGGAGSFQTGVFSGYVNYLHSTGA
ncbi:MAG: hypothetical protein ABFC80_00840 [Coriobacteriales bacterium]|nr:hypothetical protein [Actinomycetes bacterium]